MKGKSNKFLILTVCAVLTMTFSTGCKESSESTQNTEIDTAVPDNLITVKDSDTDTDTSDAVRITLVNDSVTCDDSSVNIEGSVITLSQTGSYIVSGTLDDGQIIVDAADEDKIHIILDNADINCNTGAAIYVKNADKTTITLNAGSDNSLSDSSAYEYDDTENEEPDAVIFSKDDMSINGDGSLTITAVFNNGITCKDDLKIVGGTIEVTAAGDGIKGRDSLTVAGGNITVNAQGKGLLSNNDEDETKGYIHITGGTLTLDCTNDTIHSNNAVYYEGGTSTLTTGDDGIHADNALNISGGSIDIVSSYEGLEAAAICIDGGEISIVSSDDGINAADGSSEIGFGAFGGGHGGASEDTGCSLTVNGGTIYINAEGDGIDSNGSITMTGGTAVIDGPTGSGNGSLDYGSYFTMNGGYLAAAGPAGMAQNISDSSAQCGAMISVSNAEAGSSVTVADSDGNVIISFTPSKNYSIINFSTPDIKTGTTYYIYRDGTLTDASEIGKDCYTGGTITGGTELLSYEQSSSVLSSGGFGGGGFGEGFGGYGGGRRGGENFGGNTDSDIDNSNENIAPPGSADAL